MFMQYNAASAQKKEAKRLLGIRQRPILPGRLEPSPFGTQGLNFCVRDGNRWIPFVITTGKLSGSRFLFPLHFPLHVLDSRPLSAP